MMNNLNKTFTIKLVKKEITKQKQLKPPFTNIQQIDYNMLMSKEYFRRLSKKKLWGILCSLEPTLFYKLFLHGGKSMTWNIDIHVNETKRLWKIYDETNKI